MTHDEAFLADIREHPQDDAPRLIYADWLEDNGDPERGEFVRLQIAQAHEAGFDTERDHLAWSLLSRNWDRWVVPLAELVGDASTGPWLSPKPQPIAMQAFRRGFVDHLRLTARRYVAVGEAVQRLVPLSRVLLLGAAGLGAELAACSALRHLHGLYFVDYFRSPLEPADLVALAESPHLGGLRVLGLMRNNVADVGVCALAGSPWLRHVAVLDLTDNGLSVASVAALAEAEGLGALRELSLRHNPIGDAAVAYLLRASWMGQLTSLDLSHTGITLEAMAALRQAFPQVPMFHKTEARPDTGR